MIGLQDDFSHSTNLKLNLPNVFYSKDNNILSEPLSLMVEFRVSLGSWRLEDTIQIIPVLSAPDTMKTTLSFSVSSFQLRPHYSTDQDDNWLHCGHHPRSLWPQHHWGGHNLHDIVPVLCLQLYHSEHHDGSIQKTLLIIQLPVVPHTVSSVSSHTL